MTVPTLGRIVLYTLGEHDADAINASRSVTSGAAAAGFPRVGNAPRIGDDYPAVIVRVWGDSEQSAVNLQVLLDGTDTYWVTSRTVGDRPGTWHWPTRT